MKCKKCGCFFDNHSCGMSVKCGSGFGAHLMSHNGFIDDDGIQYLSAKQKIKEEKFEVWEAPDGKCPTCYHKNKKSDN